MKNLKIKKKKLLRFIISVKKNGWTNQESLFVQTNHNFYNLSPLQKF